MSSRQVGEVTCLQSSRAAFAQPSEAASMTDEKEERKKKRHEEAQHPSPVQTTTQRERSGMEQNWQTEDSS